MPTRYEIPQVLTCGLLFAFLSVLQWLNLEVGYHQHYCLRWMLFLRFWKGPNLGLYDHCQPCLHW
jgi:hypothetical protein